MALKVVSAPTGVQQTLTVAKPQAQPNLSVGKVATQPSLKVAQPQVQQNLQVASVQQPDLAAGVVDTTGQKASPYLGTPQEHTIAELGWKIKQKYPDYNDMSDEELGAKMKAKFPDYADFEDAPAGVQPGFLKSLGQDIARPFAQVGKAGVALVDLLGSKLTSDPEQKRMLEDRGVKVATSPTFGKTPTYSKTEGFGTGLELGSYLIGGGAAKNVVQSGLKGLIKRGAVQGLTGGAAAGGVGGLGIGLQDENAGFGSVTLNTLFGTVGGGLLGTAAGAVAPIAGRVVRPLAEGVFPKLKTQRLATEFESTVNEYFGRAFKPTIAGKKTLGSVEKANKQHALGIASILDNVADESALPKTVDEALQKTVDTKKTVWAKAENAAVRAGQQGAEINLNSVADEVSQIAADPRFKLSSPNTTNYAEDLAMRLRSQGKTTPQIAEDLLADFNARAKTFFKNPNPNDINNVMVDALVSNALRKQLVDIVEKAATTGYGALRRQYGALVEMEKILTRRSLNLANKNAVTFYEGLGNILGAGDVLQGIMNFSPTQIARGWVTKSVGGLINKINDPDRLTAKLFRESYKVFKEVKNEVLPPVGNVVVPASKNRLLPAGKPNAPKAEINVPINQPARLPSLNTAAETQQGLKRVGGVGSRRTNRDGGIGKPLVSTNPLTNQLYSAAPGSLAGIEKDEQGNIKFNTKKAAAGLAIGSLAGNKKVSSLLDDAIKSSPKIFKGFKDITTKILDKLKGRSTVSKQFISDLTNSGDLKQVERDVIRQVLLTEKGDVNVTEFANKVKAELLPLKRMSIGKQADKADMGDGVRLRYESISLPDELRGSVENYDENIYRSPIKTSAGRTHFSDVDTGDYFGHTRIEDMADNKTRRVIEVQSDLYQKGRLEGEKYNEALAQSLQGDEYKRLNYLEKRIMDLEDSRAVNRGAYTSELAELKPERDALLKKALEIRNKKIALRDTELSKLQQYNDPTAHFRMVREEIKKAAQDGKTKLQFPTGETAMKIEGLGDTEYWYPKGKYGDRVLTNNEIKVGKEVVNKNNEDWIITDVLGDGKFKAMPKEHFDSFAEGKGVQDLTGQDLISYAEQHGTPNFWASKETFDISGKVDTNNPIYKFYEKDMGKYLKNRYGANLMTDDNGVTWYELPVKKDYARLPVEAFGLLPIPLALQKKNE